MMLTLGYIINWKQRITIPEIKMHPWFLKNLPLEFMDEGEGVLQNDDHVNEESSEITQSIEEILAIVQEARKPGEGPKVGEQFVGGSMDLDDIDADADIDDIETSGDFVCALWMMMLALCTLFLPQKQFKIRCCSLTR